MMMNKIFCAGDLIDDRNGKTFLFIRFSTLYPGRILAARVRLGASNSTESDVEFIDSLGCRLFRGGALWEKKAEALGRLSDEEYSIKLILD